MTIGNYCEKCKVYILPGRWERHLGSKAHNQNPINKKPYFCKKCGHKLKEEHICTFKCPVCNSKNTVKDDCYLKCLRCGFENQRLPNLAVEDLR